MADAKKKKNWIKGAEEKLEKLKKLHPAAPKKTGAELMYGAKK